MCKISFAFYGAWQPTKLRHKRLETEPAEIFLKIILISRPSNTSLINLMEQLERRNESIK